jgi:proteasome accessory factor A
LDGRTAGAVDLLYEFLGAARRAFAGRDTETEIVLRIWEGVLAALDTDPEILVGKVDWITKRWLFREFLARERLGWGDPWLKAQDLEFHHIDPARNLGVALVRTPPEWDVPAEEIFAAMRGAPRNTRAQVRSRMMRLLKNQSIRYFVDWEVIDAEGGHSLSLLNPFDPAPAEADDWTRLLHLE